MENFIRYNISSGAHYSDKSIVRSVNLSQQIFEVKFDSTAVYATVDPGNQFDINKLYGFTEGNHPHINSARLGWAYHNDSLRLYAYAYNNGQRLSKEICPVKIGEVIHCSITLEVNSYLFSVNNFNERLSRALDTSHAVGYQLYPYFGGDEMAPHSISIFINELQPGL